MMAFDAVTVAVTAFRRLDAIPHTANERDALTNGFTSMTHGRPACGASGPIGLAPGKNPPAGSAINKPIPVMQLGADLEPQFRALGYPAESDPAYPVSASGGQRRWIGKCGL